MPSLPSSSALYPDSHLHAACATGRRWSVCLVCWRHGSSSSSTWARSSSSCGLEFLTERVCKWNCERGSPQGERPRTTTPL